MADFNKITQTALPLAGGVAGAMYGGAGGAMAGSAVGSAVASGLGLMEDTPSIPGSTATQDQLLDYRMKNIEDLRSLDGMTARDVANINQGMASQLGMNLTALQTMPLSMDPIDRQRITKELLSRSKQAQVLIPESIRELDAKAEAQRKSALSRELTLASAEADKIASLEKAKAVAELNLEITRQNNFNNAIGAMSKAFMVGMDAMEQGDKQEQERKADLEELEELSKPEDEWFISTFLEGE